MNGLTPTTLKAVLGAIIAADALLDGAKLALFTDAVPVAADPVLGDLTECDFGGYARSAAVTYGTRYIDDQGNASVQVAPKEFKATDGVTPETATYVGLVDEAGTGLLALAELDPPLQFHNVNDAYFIGINIKLPVYDGASDNVVP